MLHENLGTMEKTSYNTNQRITATHSIVKVGSDIVIVYTEAHN